MSTKALAKLVLLTCLPLAACTKTSDNSASNQSDAGVTDGGTSTYPPCETYIPTRIRRLTRTEYDNSVRELLGVETHLGQTFAVEDEVQGYTNHDRLEVSTLLADQIDAAAEQLAHEAVYERGELPILAPCDSGEEEQCVRGFVTTFGKKAFRRPLTETEVDDLWDLFQSGRGEEGDYQAGIELVLQGILSSPQFLYRTELGAPMGEGAVVELTPYEVASAISYMTVASAPDDLLLAAADADELKTPEQREAHVRRLLQDPKARQQLRQFVVEWLGLKNLGTLQKDNLVYPEFSVELRSSIQAETNAFVDYVLFDGDHSMATLLSADFTFADSRLARLYGVPEPQGDGLKKVSLAGVPRRGILNQAGLLATYAHNNETSPIRRGKLIWTRLLCNSVPPPPPNVIAAPPPKDPNATTRQRVAAHTSDPTCRACHEAIDPIGFGLEDFDGIGKYRTKENNLDVDASGALLGTPSSDGSFTGGAQLSQKLAASKDVSACVTKQFFRYGVGRIERSDDACVIREARAAFEGGNLDVREILVTLVRSNDFVRRQVVQP